ncbi:hypothetical protein BV25DRAFT_817165 [Artomyces pyxidatus]|uniref:Uncharacterized protein n=1 Tax=Artomyces pyxidatus TaxID=48021 RepID=A0ACB8SXU5_9AGAM|nr:hypothetical protein BV25DRAFT_817165 [Artomyces pyxidatus]
MRRFDLDFVSPQRPASAASRVSIPSLETVNSSDSEDGNESGGSSSSDDLQIYTDLLDADFHSVMDGPLLPNSVEHEDVVHNHQEPEDTHSMHHELNALWPPPDDQFDLTAAEDPRSVEQGDSQPGVTRRDTAPPLTIIPAPEPSLSDVQAMTGLATSLQSGAVSPFMTDGRGRVVWSSCRNEGARVRSARPCENGDGAGPSN